MGSAVRAGVSRSSWLLVAVISLGAGCASDAPTEVSEQSARYPTVVALPPADVDGSQTLERVLSDRRSVRDYSSDPLGQDEIGQLLWAGQGITDDRGRRTSPSAGARYPLELYVITERALMHYLPEGHRVEQRDDAATLDALPDTAFGQDFVGRAPVVIAIAADPSRTEQEYGAVAWDLVNREAGHAAQNILLQATALGLGAVPVGGFDPAAMQRLLALPPGQEVLYLIPIGVPVT